MYCTTQPLSPKLCLAFEFRQMGVFYFVFSFSYLISNRHPRSLISLIFPSFLDRSIVALLR